MPKMRGTFGVQLEGTRNRNFESSRIFRQTDRSGSGGRTAEFGAIKMRHVGLRVKALNAVPLMGNLETKIIIVQFI